MFYSYDDYSIDRDLLLAQLHDIESYHLIFPVDAKKNGIMSVMSMYELNDSWEKILRRFQLENMLHDLARRFYQQ